MLIKTIASTQASIVKPKPGPSSEFSRFFLSLDITELRSIICLTERFSLALTKKPANRDSISQHAAPSQSFSPDLSKLPKKELCEKHLASILFGAKTDMLNWEQLFEALIDSKFGEILDPVLVSENPDSVVFLQSMSKAWLVPIRYNKTSDDLDRFACPFIQRLREKYNKLDNLNFSDPSLVIKNQRTNQQTEYVSATMKILDTAASNPALLDNTFDQPNDPLQMTIKGQNRATMYCNFYLIKDFDQLLRQTFNYSTKAQ
ncbi:hypothetical protein ACFL96_00280 [Thermoproteota archaeon]